MPSSNIATSASLIGRLRQRDCDAWSRFVMIYCPLVYGWARRSGLQQADVDDIVQEVFRSVSMGIDNYRDSETLGSFRRWLWGITRNKLRDYYSNLGRNPPAQGGSTANARMHAIPTLPDEESAIIPAFDTDAWIMRRALGLMKSDFEERTWRAFWRMAIDVQSASDVALELGMSKQAVRQAKFRVLKRLRTELQEQL